MFPNTPSSSLGGRVTSRRRFLATVGVAAGVSTAGCSRIRLPRESEGEGDTIEIVAGNWSDEPAVVAVRIEDENGEALFSRVYEIKPGYSDESAGVEPSPQPSTVTAFTPNGTAATWEYSPDAERDCDGADIQVYLTRDGTFEFSYGC